MRQVTGSLNHAGLPVPQVGLILRPGQVLAGALAAGATDGSYLYFACGVSSLCGAIGRVNLDSTGAVTDFVILNADWSAKTVRVPDPGASRRWRRVIDTSLAPGETSRLHFPSYGKESAELLVRERRVAALGVDTASIDHGPSTDFIVHEVANGANVPGLENLANLEALPARGFWIVALPMKIAGGSGGPLRIIALLPGVP